MVACNTFKYHCTLFRSRRLSEWLNYLKSLRNHMNVISVITKLPEQTTSKITHCVTLVKI